jgi:hypothetical protein
VNARERVRLCAGTAGDDRHVADTVVLAVHVAFGVGLLPDNSATDARLWQLAPATPVVRPSADTGRRCC